MMEKDAVEGLKMQTSPVERQASSGATEEPIETVRVLAHVHILQDSSKWDLHTVREIPTRGVWETSSPSGRCSVGAETCLSLLSSLLWSQGVAH